LAKLKHPDRLSGLNIPEKYNSIANENFSRIQESYKLIIEFKKIDKL
jgi:DnaJ-domain-containing protein 1